jgi:E3 ubiquitin-protein ligase HERC2
MTRRVYFNVKPFVGHVVLPGAESLRVEFDRQCSTEKRHDPLTLSDGVGRILAIRSGRDWADWSQEVRVQGFQLKFHKRFAPSV